jgi:hypothetical protein
MKALFLQEEGLRSSLMKVDEKLDHNSLDSDAPISKSVPNLVSFSSSTVFLLLLSLQTTLFLPLHVCLFFLLQSHRHLSLYARFCPFSVPLLRGFLVRGEETSTAGNDHTQVFPARRARLPFARFALICMGMRWLSKAIHSFLTLLATAIVDAKKNTILLSFSRKSPPLQTIQPTDIMPPH